MVRRFLALAVLAALATALLAPAASAAPGVDAGVKQRSAAVCGTQIAFYGKLESLAMVRVIKDEYDDTAPAAADADLVDWIQGYYGSECGSTLDAYVRLRTNSAQFAWYRQVVLLNT